MKIRMLEDAPGSPDGIHVQDYDAGVEYDVTTVLGETFVRYGHAEPAEGPTTEPRPKAKAKTSARKDAGAPPENKAS